VIIITFIWLQPVLGGPGCKHKTGRPGDFRYLTIDSAEGLREYNLYVHPRYKNSRPTPLVILLHGASWTPDLAMWYSNMTAYADTSKFILAAPRGLNNRWRAFPSSPDVTFIEDLIARIKEDYCINPDRIFVVGMSNGGGMSYRLSCDLSHLIAAIGSVAAGVSYLVNDYICDPLRAVPVLHFHGTGDLLVPYEGGFNPISGSYIPPVYGMIETVAEMNGCSRDTDVVYEKGDVTCIEFEGCEATVKLCIVEEGGHTWPGAIDLYDLDKELYWWAYPNTTEDIDASREFWKFFAAHGMDEED
jgi:polyhydroxybutyrate depolymerase